MRRLFLLLFLALTVVQLALPAMQSAAASLAISGVSGERPDHKTTSAQQPCESHVAGSPSAGCDLGNGPVCNLCDICQACHQAAAIAGQGLTVQAAFNLNIFPPISAGYASADHAPGFKPPIL